MMHIHIVTSFLFLLRASSSLVSASFHHRLSCDDIVVDGTQELLNLGVVSHNEPDPVPSSTRAHWMRRARSALLELTGSPCPFGAFGTAIVNHTARDGNDLGKLICIGANRVAETGNPILHGEMAAINNCTSVLSSPPYNLSGKQVASAWESLSLYTTAEPCSMCASAINWGNFRELIYATSIWTLLDLKWSQIPLTSKEVFRRSPTGNRTRILGGILEGEMDELFGWQFRKQAKCPTGCNRNEKGHCGPTVT